MPTDRWHERARAWLVEHTGYNAMPTCVQTEYRSSLANLLSTVAAEVAAETWEAAATHVRVALAYDPDAPIAWPTLIREVEAQENELDVLRDRELARAATRAKP